MSLCDTRGSHRPYRPPFKDEKTTWQPILFEIHDTPAGPIKESDARPPVLEYLVMQLCADCHLVYWEKLEPPADLPVPGAPQPT